MKLSSRARDWWLLPLLLLAADAQAEGRFYGMLRSRDLTLSPNVENYLKTLEPSGRREMNPQLIQDIRNLPGGSGRAARGSNSS